MLKKVTSISPVIRAMTSLRVDTFFLCAQTQGSTLATVGSAMTS